VTDTEESFEDALQQAAQAAVQDIENVAKNLDQDVREGFDAVTAAFPNLGEWSRALQLKNGRYCGPGEDPSQPMTPIDPCCQKHDDTYTSLGYDYGSMWSVKALLATRDADAALVACVNGVGDEGMDDATITYKAGLVAAFEGRVQVADWLKSQGYGS
jgi:hypothetical protein